MKEYKDSEEIKRQLRIWVQECENWRKHKEANCFRGCIDLIDRIPAADAIEADRLGRVGRLMLPYKGCPRGPIGRLGMAGGKTQDKKAILIEELCCMDTFEDVDGNVWRPVQEEALQEVIEILRKVVDVVRCKDCEYYAAMITDTVSGNMEIAPWGICTQPWFNSDEYDVQENGYCSYGERRMDKEE